jgi:transposase InsO family protein
MGNHGGHDRRHRLAKKVFTQIANRRSKAYKGKKIKAVTLYERFGISRQAFYQGLQKASEALSHQKNVIKLVQDIREDQPRIGTEKLYGLIKGDLDKMHIKIGRCKLNSILKENGMLVRKKKTAVITTNSHHRFKKYPNLIKDTDISQPEQVWVADITYIRTDEGFNYLHLITDAYSKLIVGYELSDNLKAESTLKALKMALNGRKYPERELTHHSDRGIQYCSDDYIEMLMKNGLTISMTENTDPYENAIAERVNGILKQEFSIGEGFKNHLMAMREVKKSIYIYNHKRPHRSCGMLTPIQAHLNGKYKLPSYAFKRKQKNELSLTKNS